MTYRYKPSRTQDRRRPWEFSKKLAAWAVAVATASANRHGLDADGFPLESGGEDGVC